MQCRERKEEYHLTILGRLNARDKSGRAALADPAAVQFSRTRSARMRLRRDCGPGPPRRIAMCRKALNLLADPAMSRRGSDRRKSTVKNSDL
jgi:hypothetical protein